MKNFDYRFSVFRIELEREEKGNKYDNFYNNNEDSHKRKSIEIRFTQCNKEEKEH